MAPNSDLVMPGGDPSAREYSEGPADVQGDVCLRQRFFTYPTEAGTVAGKDFNVMFTIDRPAKQVWRYLKDFNLWQNSYGYYYSGVVGDREGHTVHLTVKKGDEAIGSYAYRVLRVIPEYLIVAYQPAPSDGSNGGISAGFYVIMLNEHDGKTVVTILMEQVSRTQADVEEALVPARKQAPESHRFWRDVFVPALKNLVYECK